MTAEVVTLSHPGRVRSNNEDSVAVAPELGLAVLADGMGGYQAGEVAAEMATSLVIERLRGALNPAGDAETIERAMRQAAIHANEAIIGAARANASFEGMGTTLVMSVLRGAQVHIGHLGDSRAYRLHHGRLQPLTRDHSLMQEQVDAGLITPEMARRSTYRNLVTRALGVESRVELEVRSHAVESGDLLLLCSDGLHDMLPDDWIAAILSRPISLQARAESLLTAANDAGGRDNISLILTHCV